MFFCLFLQAVGNVVRVNSRSKVTVSDWGIITTNNGNGTCDIAFDDGDIECAVETWRIEVSVFVC